MLLCDLCGEAKACKPREIEGREYDICADCWKPLAQRLKGKGREIKERQTVFLPPIPEPEPVKETMPGPGEPPKIWGSAGRPH